MHESAKRLYEAAGRPSGSTELARLMETTPQAVTNWEKRGVSKEAALSAEVLFDCSPRWLLTGFGRSPDGRFLSMPPAPPNLAAALPVILNALAEVPAAHRDELLDRLAMWVRYRSEADRQRLAELLDPVKADVIKAVTPVPSVESPRFQPQQLSTTERSRE